MRDCQKDDERERQIRDRLREALPGSNCALGANGTAFLLRRLDEARAERERVLALLTEHARKDSTGDEAKAAFHIVANWLAAKLGAGG